jgi:rhodanese-related sulfurtransferase
MGPLVPDIITNELNLLIALLLGIAFGFVLEQAGFSSSRKLTGLFYGTDFTVLRVFFTAGVTAMIGVLVLVAFGWLDAELIYINPTFLHSAILGGAIMGVGFVLGGYCPGTSFCGAAVGRIDGMMFAAGGFLGIFAFGELFPSFRGLYTAGSKGDLLVSAALGISPGLFAAGMILMALGTFVFTTRLERKVNPQSGTFAFPVRPHRAAAMLLVVIALALAVMPDRNARLSAKAADAAYLRDNPVRLMAGDELAVHIMDRDRKFQLIDARAAADYAKFTLPGAVNLAPGALFGKQSRSTLAGPHVTKVFIGRNAEESIRAAALARLNGHENVAALEGGMEQFSGTILNQTAAAKVADIDTREFRQRAAREIAVLIKQQSGPKPVKTLRRVQGGCGG